MFGSYSHTHSEISRTNTEVEELRSLLLDRLYRKNSTWSLDSDASFAPSVKTRTAFKQICKRLFKAGARGDTIQDLEGQIVALLESPNAPLVINHGVFQTTALVVHRKQIPSHGGGTNTGAVAVEEARGYVGGLGMEIASAGALSHLMLSDTRGGYI